MICSTTSCFNPKSDSCSSRLCRLRGELWGMRRWKSAFQVHRAQLFSPFRVWVQIIPSDQFFPWHIFILRPLLDTLLTLPVTIILRVSTAYLDRGFILHWDASPRRVWPWMEWHPQWPQYRSPRIHFAWWLLCRVSLPHINGGPSGGITHGLSWGCAP